MAKVDISRVGPGTLELIRDATTGAYSLKNVGFETINKLTIPDLSTQAATTTPTTTAEEKTATDLTDTFVGFSDGNYSADATATVLCAGNVSADHSSLSPGTKYYSTGSGGVSATPANPEVFVGTAVTPTTITVKN